MTYCLGIKVRQGLIGLADGRITTGNQSTSGPIDDGLWV